MATGTITPTVNSNIPPDVSERYITYYGTLALSAAGDTYATGGIVCSFAGKVDQASVPVQVDVWDETAAKGFVYRYIPGTTIANGKVLLRGQQPSASTSGILPLDEFGNGVAFNAANMGVSTATLKFAAKFRKGA